MSFNANDRFVTQKIFEITKSLGKTGTHFLKLVNLPPRKGDNAQMARIELVGLPEIRKVTENGELKGESKKGKTKKGEIQASMPDDYDNGLMLEKCINKYIELVENEETGEFISNIKHLRGSCMKMLRQHPDRPEFRVLKSFTLFITFSHIW